MAKIRKSIPQRAVRKLGRLLATYVLSRRLLQPVNNILLHTAMYGLGVHNQLTGDPTPNERRFLKRLGKHNSHMINIIDVGANAGQYACFLSEVFPQSKIISFEPNPVAYKALVENTSGKNIQTINLACSESEGEAILFDFKDRPGSASASLNADVIEFAGHDAIATEIKTVRLDKYLIDHNIEHVDFLKVDAEGHDLSVLKGADTYLKANNIDIIQFEFARMNCLNHILIKDFFDVLNGYTLYRLAGNGDLLPLGEYEPLTCELFGHQNLIAINNNTNNGKLH